MASVGKKSAHFSTFAQCFGKDPVSGWSHDSFKNLLLSGVGKVSNYMHPHAKNTFQM